MDDKRKRLQLNSEIKTTASEMKNARQDEQQINITEEKVNEFEDLMTETL